MTLTPAERSGVRVIIALLALFLATFAVSNVSAKENAQVTICHATGSADNPYVEITVAWAAAQAHLDGTHPSHHGPGPDDLDYIVEAHMTCPPYDDDHHPTPAPTPDPSLAPLPGPDGCRDYCPAPSVVPTPTPSTSVTAQPTASATATTIVLPNTALTHP